MKIVLFGKNGQLGWEFQRILPIFGEVISLERTELDLSDLQAIQKILSELKPNLIINASAYTEVDLAEKETDLAMKINGLAPGLMAEISRKLNAALIHFSTDYVFDGRKNAPYTESDQTNPLNVYGQSKLMGEENIKQAGDAYLILRTSWVYSLRGNSFVNKVLKWSRQKENLKIVSDQISSPTWARMLAEVTGFLLAKIKRTFMKISTRDAAFTIWQVTDSHPVMNGQNRFLRTILNGQNRLFKLLTLLSVKNSQRQLSVHFFRH